VQINSALDLLRRVAGRLSFVPVDLVLNPKEVQPDGKKSTIYALDIVLPVGLANVTQLQPLLAQSGAAAPPPSEALPDDLYPRSQTTPALPAPAPPEDTRDVRAMYEAAVTMGGEDRVKAMLKAAGFTSLNKTTADAMEEILWTVRETPQQPTDAVDF